MGINKNLNEEMKGKVWIFFFYRWILVNKVRRKEGNGKLSVGRCWSSNCRRVLFCVEISGGKVREDGEYWYRFKICFF